MHHVIEEIRRERERQIQSEGWTYGHDDRHDRGEMAMAAACYAAPEPVSIVRDRGNKGFVNLAVVDAWPWESKWDKRKKHGRRRQLIIAAALIVAEVERLERMEVGRLLAHHTGDA